MLYRLKRLFSVERYRLTGIRKECGREAAGAYFQVLSRNFQEETEGNRQRCDRVSLEHATLLRPSPSLAVARYLLYSHARVVRPCVPIQKVVKVAVR